jgi:diaminopimelate decarboxylase
MISAGSTSAGAWHSLRAFEQAPAAAVGIRRCDPAHRGRSGVEVEIEPGRLISGNAGLLVSGVIYVKKGDGRDFLILDAAMNDLIRPAMYGAWHDIVPVVEPAPGAEQTPYDIVGPVCETGDTFAKQRTMPPRGVGRSGRLPLCRGLWRGDGERVQHTPLIPEVLVKEDQFAVIRARPTFDEMINRDTVPEWV